MSKESSNYQPMRKTVKKILNVRQEHVKVY